MGEMKKPNGIVHAFDYLAEHHQVLRLQIESGLGTASNLRRCSIEPLPFLLLYEGRLSSVGKDGVMGFRWVFRREVALQRIAQWFSYFSTEHFSS